MDENYKMRNGLSLKPSTSFFVPFVNRRRTQLKSLDNMANGFKRYEIVVRFQEGRINRQEQRQRTLLS